jgi:hypothetical protein
MSEMTVVIALLSILTQFGTPVAALAASGPTPNPTFTPYIPRFHIRPSQIRGKPMPSPRPKRHRVRGVHTKPKNTSPVVIAPKAGVGATARPVVPPATFELSKSAKPGKLILKYKANISNLEFDSRAPFVIQLVPQGALKVTPLVVTRSDWPKNGAFELSYQGASKSKDNVIIGKAAFTVCVHQTKECRKQKVPLVFRFK